MINKQFKYRSTLLVLSLSSFSALAKSPEKGFYTIVDAYGRITIVANDNEKNKDVKQAGTERNTTQKPNISTEKKREISYNTSTDTSITANPSQNVGLAPDIKANRPQKNTINRLDTVEKDNVALQKEVELKEFRSLSEDTTKEHKNHATHVEKVVENKRGSVTSFDADNIKTSHTVILSDVQQAKTAINSSDRITTTGNDQRIGITKDGLVDFQKGQYVDSQVLEDKAFNLKDEKRFYAVPNSLGGIDYVQKKSGVNLKNLINVGQRIPLFNVSSQYQTIDKKSLMALLPSQCIASKQLRKIKLLDVRSAVSLWPRPVDKSHFQKNIIKLSKTAEQIVVQSFSTSEEKPTYYWPLPVFLDSKGCILEGVGSFYQESTQATWLQQSSLIGNLLAPKNASYLLLTPIERSQDLKQVTLTRTGQLRLSVHGGRK